MALLDGLSEAFRRLDCALLGSSAYILGGLRGVTGSGQGGLEAGINGLRRLRGCDPANDVEVPPPEFEGGQCPGISYQIFLTQNNVVTGVRQPEQLRGVRAGPLTISQVSPPPNCGDGVVSEAERYIHTAGEDPTTGVALGNTGAGSCTLFSYGTTIRTQRSDGLGDDCGDPPPVFPPPTNINFDVDVEFVNEGDDIVNITIPVEFKPFNVNFNGDVSFPFDFNLGGIDFSGEVTFAPRFSLNINPPRLSPGPSTPPPLADPNDEVPLAPRGNKVVGVIITATLNPNIEVSSIDQQTMPDTFVPRLGSVKFAYSFGAATFWSNDIDVKGTRVFIPCPFSQGADAVAASPQPGVTFTIAQLTGPPLATVFDLV